MNTQSKIQRWIKDESGQALSEYGLLLALIAVVVVGAIVAFRKQIIDKFTEAADVVDKAGETTP